MMSTNTQFEEQLVPTLAINWYEAAAGKPLTGPGKVYFQFMAIWIGFSSLYESYACSQSKDLTQRGEDGRWPTARQLWEPYLKAKGIQEKHAALMHDDKKYKEAVECLAQGVHKMGRSRLFGEDNEFLGQVFDGPRRANPGHAVQVVAVINLVRDNIFHGYKEVTNERDNQIVECAFYILFELLKQEMEAIKKDKCPWT